MSPLRFSLSGLALALVSSQAHAQALTYSLNGNGSGWPAGMRDEVARSMDEAVALYNACGHFPKRLTANFSAGVPTAQANYDGWIDFGGSRNTRVALHEIAHALGTGTFWPFNGGPWSQDSAAGRLIKLYEGQGAVLNTGGSHFWPYGLNYDNEDGPAARERQCKLVAALRFDMGIVKDSDGDGLPDDWETFHFRDLSKSGTDDPDADGIQNRHEYATDTDPNSASPVVDGRTYRLRSQLSGRALSVVNGARDENALTELRDADDQAWQEWTIRALGDGYYRIDNVHSGKVLELPNSDTSSGRPVRQASWTGALKQQWRITTGPGAQPNHYQIANRDTARVVDGLDGKSGTPVQQYPFLGNIPQQFWRFEEVSGGTNAADAGASPSDAGLNDAGTSTLGDAEPGALDAQAQAPQGTSDAAMTASSDAQPDDDTDAPEQDERDPMRTSGGCSGLPGSTPAPSLLSALSLAALSLAARMRRRRSS